MLGLNEKQPKWPLSGNMITTSDSLPGFQISEVLGIVEGVTEGSFNQVNIAGIGLSQGGGLNGLVGAARENLAQVAADVGADAVIGFRYQILGRDLEKSVLAYGTAVRCHRED